MFVLLIWKEFKNKKMIQMSSVVKEEDEIDIIEKMKKYNADQRKITTDYAIYPIEELLNAQDYEIVKKIPEGWFSVIIFIYFN